MLCTIDAAPAKGWLIGTGRFPPPGHFTRQRSSSWKMGRDLGAITGRFQRYWGAIDDEGDLGVPLLLWQAQKDAGVG
jgi:hypothetical protein